jgi:hypothetical protein
MKYLPWALLWLFIACVIGGCWASVFFDRSEKEYERECLKKSARRAADGSK